ALHGGLRIRGVVIEGNTVYKFAIERGQAAELSMAQPHCAPPDAVEDRLDVGRRLADDAQDLTCSRLLLQRLGHLRVSSGEIAVLLWQLGEQSRVLEGNHALVSKVLEERTLVVADPAGLAAGYPDPPDRLVMAE